ncbi:MAG: sigma factor-like helix-turn-helix DNA-binding protein [Acidobacteriota bacterium]
MGPRFFGGLTHLEIAEALGLSVANVERHRSLAKGRLALRLERAPKDVGGQ